MAELKSLYTFNNKIIDLIGKNFYLEYFKQNEEDIDLTTIYGLMTVFFYNFKNTTHYAIRFKFTKNVDFTNPELVFIVKNVYEVRGKTQQECLSKFYVFFKTIAKQINVSLNLLSYRKSCVCYWTIDSNCTHALEIKNTGYGSNESIGANVFVCDSEEIAKQKVYEAKNNKNYGNVYIFTNEYDHTFGYALHYPRYESEGNGFINFHSIASFEKILPEDKERIKYRKQNDYFLNK